MNNLRAAVNTFCERLKSCVKNFRQLAMTLPKPLLIRKLSTNDKSLRAYNTSQFRGRI